MIIEAIKYSVESNEGNKLDEQKTNKYCRYHSVLCCQLCFRAYFIQLVSLCCSHRLHWKKNEKNKNKTKKIKSQKKSIIMTSKIVLFLIKVENVDLIKMQISSQRILTNNFHIFPLSIHHIFLFLIFVPVCFRFFFSSPAK